MKPTDWTWLEQNEERVRNMVQRTATNLAEEAWLEVLRKYPRLLVLFDEDYGVPLDAYLYMQLKRYVVKWVMAYAKVKDRYVPMPEDVVQARAQEEQGVVLDVSDNLRQGEHEVIANYLAGVTARAQTGSPTSNAKRTKKVLNRLRIDMATTALVAPKDTNLSLLSLLGLRWHTQVECLDQVREEYDLLLVCGVTNQDSSLLPNFGAPTYLEYTRKQWQPMRAYARPKLAVLLPSTSGTWWDMPIRVEYVKESISEWAEGNRRFIL